MVRLATSSACLAVPINYAKPWPNSKGNCMPPNLSQGDSAEFRIAVIGAESNGVTLLDTSIFLYDFNIAYELARLAADDTYAAFQFSFNVWQRNGRPLRRNARLRVVRLREES